MAALNGRNSGIDSLQAAKHQRICKSLPKPLLLARDQRASKLVCHGLALPSGVHWPFQEVFDRFLKRRHQASRADYSAIDNPEAINVEETTEAESVPRLAPVKALLLDATASAFQVGLAWTGIALRLAKRVVDDMRKTLSHATLGVSSQISASQLMQNAQAELMQKARRENLENQGKDAAFMQMLHNLDRCHMNHEEKWALFIKHTADKAEFSERWQHLYKLAKESKTAVDTLLRPDASRTEINKFWRSAETSAIIAEENALKKLVFAQVFTAGKV